MKPSTLLFIAASSLGLTSAASIPEEAAHSIEARACFKSGATFGSQQNAAISAAEKACKDPLIGTYQKRETRVKCYGIGGGKHVKLTVGLTGSNAPSKKKIAYAECYNGLLSEIMKCSRGGDTTYGNWRYRADPNSGNC